MGHLEKVVRQTDSNKLEINKLSEKIEEASEIIAFCAGKLTEADREIGELLQGRRLPEE